MPQTLPRGGKPRRRSSGRPGPGDVAVGRQALIETTCDILKVVPPHAITMAMVAKTAGVAPSLLKYYFRDRATLMAAAAQNLLTKSGDARDALADADSPESALRARVKALLDIEVQYPFMHRLVIDEVINSDRPSALDERKRITDRSLQTYAGLLTAAAQDQHGPLDPLFLYMSVVGMCGFFVSGSGILRETLGPDYDRAALMRQYADFMASMVMNGLRPRPAESA